MAERPIIFSAPMVRALIDGRKTQTRRLASSPLRRCEVGDRLYVRETVAAEELSLPPTRRKATAREQALLARTVVVVCDEMDGTDGLRYAADDAWIGIANSQEAGEAWSDLFHYSQKGGARPKGLRGKWVPSIHMPRWASRLTLIVEAVRVEPLQAISDRDAIAEGILPLLERAPERGWLDYIAGDLERGVTPVASYQSLWASLHTDDGQRWDDNPNVLALTFRVELGNIDQVRA